MAISWIIDKAPVLWTRALSACCLCLLAAAGCGGDLASSPGGISEESLVVVVLEKLRVSLETGDRSGVLSRVSSDYQHQGRGGDALDLWLTDLLGSSPYVVSMDDLSVVVERDEDGEPVSAEVAYTLTIDRCAASETAPTDEGATPEATVTCEHVLRCHTSWDDDCGWLTHFVPGAQGWEVSGDGSPWGLGLHLVSTSDGLLVDGTVFAPSGDLSEVSLDWSGADEEISLEPLSPSMWQVPAGTQTPDHLALDGSLPWSLVVSLTDDDETTEVTHTLSSVLHSFATEVSPTGEASPPFTFRWTEPEDVTGGSRVRIRDDEGDILWTSEITFAKEMTYSGPGLEPGLSYALEIHTHDLYGQRAISSFPLIPLDDTGITPKPTSVSPSTGPTTGGTELTVIGADFLEGVRVEIGSVSCIGVERLSDGELRCTTPTMDEGPHHVAVINASGAVGLLEEAFYASPP